MLFAAGPELRTRLADGQQAGSDLLPGHITSSGHGLVQVVLQLMHGLTVYIRYTITAFAFPHTSFIVSTNSVE